MIPEPIGSDGLGPGEWLLVYGGKAIAARCESILRRSPACTPLERKGGLDRWRGTQRNRCRLLRAETQPERRAENRWLAGKGRERTRVEVGCRLGSSAVPPRRAQQLA